jgi:DNA polymerase I-like protein with 3'-5' exonuclease and polymerase domains
MRNALVGRQRTLAMRARHFPVLHSGRRNAGDLFGRLAVNLPTLGTASKQINVEGIKMRPHEQAGALSRI